MRHLKYDLLLFVLFFFCKEGIQAFSQMGYEIKDLQETEFSLFQQEAEHWKIFSDVIIPNILISNNTPGAPVLGGPNVLKLYDPEQSATFFHRVYTGLPPHKSVSFTGTFWYFAGEPEGLQPFIEVSLISNREIPIILPDLKLDMQSQAEDQFQTAQFGYFNTRGPHQHSELSLIIRVSAAARPEKPNSLGIREITLHLNDASMINEDENKACFFSQEITKLRNNRCHCPFGQGLNKDSVCETCAANCLNCLKFDPLQCVQCSPGMSWRGHECNNCHFNCKGCTGPSSDDCSGCNAGLYDYRNGTCLATCEWPLKEVETQDGEKLCIPSCKSNEYLWDLQHTSLTLRCLGSCPVPLVSLTDNNGILVCQNPCLNKRDFLYTNGSCIATCPVPLVNFFDLGTKFCKNPCESTSAYLYANRSCLKECPAPLQIRSESIANFCVNPCHSQGLYLYKNGSCLPSCSFPMKTRGEFGVKYCLLPCRMTEEYILKDGSCSSECPSPLTQRTELGVGTFCLNPCESDGHFVSKNGSCLLNCPRFFAVKIEYGVKYCLNSCSSDQYYFEKSKSCLKGCPDPLLKVKSKEGINLCKTPSPEEANYFLYDDHSCHKDCPAPLIMKEEGYCKSPCLNGNEYVNKDGGCQEICEYPETVIRKGSYQICLIDEKRDQMAKMSEARKIIKISNSLSEIGGILSCLLDAGDPTSLLMLPLLNMFEQIATMEMRLPVSIGTVLNREKNLEKSQISVHLQENIDYRIRTLRIVCLIYILLVGIKIFLKQNGRSQVSQLLDSIWSIFAIMTISMSGNAVLYLFLTDDFKNFQWNHMIGSHRMLNCFAVVLFTAFVGYKIINEQRI